MKIPNRKKNDRACFWSHPTLVYSFFSKKYRNSWKKPEPVGVPLDQILAFKSTLPNHEL